MTTETKRKPRRFTLILFIYALMVSYPAYVQVSAWTNHALDTWANQRVASIPMTDDDVLAAMDTQRTGAVK